MPISAEDLHRGNRVANQGQLLVSLNIRELRPTAYLGIQNPVSWAIAFHRTMPAISFVERPQTVELHSIAKRSNWASKNPGVVLVFCIVFLVATGVFSLMVYRKCSKRRRGKESYVTTS